MGASKPLVKRNDNDEMRPEYDFSHGVRGKHYEAYRAGTNVVFLDSDVAQAFGDSAAVNQALRLLLQLARTNVPGSVQTDKTAQPPGRAPRRSRLSGPNPGLATPDFGPRTLFYVTRPCPSDLGPFLPPRAFPDLPCPFWKSRTPREQGLMCNPPRIRSHSMIGWWSAIRMASGEGAEES